MLAAAREDSDDEVGERGMEAMISGGGEGRARKFKNSLFLHLIIVNPFFLFLFLLLRPHSRALVCIYFRLGCARGEGRVGCCSISTANSVFPSPTPYTVYSIFPYRTNTAAHYMQ